MLLARGIGNGRVEASYKPGGCARDNGVVPTKERRLDIQERLLNDERAKLVPSTLPQGPQIVDRSIDRVLRLFGRSINGYRADEFLGTKAE